MHNTTEQKIYTVNCGCTKAEDCHFQKLNSDSTAENKGQQKGEVGNIIWRNATDYPKKSKNYICELEIVEDGLTFWPVSYVRFDADSNTWEKISRCGTDGKVTKWLDESATDKPEELQEEVERLRDGWISVEERLPEEGDRYWCYVEELNDLGTAHFQWNCAYHEIEKTFSDSTLKNGERVTHWRPLPPPPNKP